MAIEWGKRTGSLRLSAVCTAARTRLTPVHKLLAPSYPPKKSFQSKQYSSPPNPLVSDCLPLPDHTTPQPETSCPDSLIGKEKVHCPSSASHSTSIPSRHDTKNTPDQRAKPSRQEAFSEWRSGFEAPNKLQADVPLHPFLRPVRVLFSLRSFCIGSAFVCCSLHFLVSQIFPT